MASRWLLNGFFGIGHFRNFGLMLGFDYFYHLVRDFLSPTALLCIDVGACLAWLAVVAWVLLRVRRSVRGHLDPAGSVGLGLIVGGSVSNLADRLFLGGYVVDYLVLFRWGDVYNLGDLAAWPDSSFWPLAWLN